jgi:uncharacterized membrane protein YkoI
MKLKLILSCIAAAAITVGCVSEENEHHEKEASQSELMAQAKVSKDDALKTALAKVPGGTVKEGELEMEKGKLIWSFGFTIPDSKDIKEVNVDAITGAVVGDVETETPESEAKEADEDSAKSKKDKD